MGIAGLRPGALDRAGGDQHACWVMSKDITVQPDPVGAGLPGRCQDASAG